MNLPLSFFIKINLVFHFHHFPLLNLLKTVSQSVCVCFPHQWELHLSNFEDSTFFEKSVLKETNSINLNDKQIRHTTKSFIKYQLLIGKNTYKVHFWPWGVLRGRKIKRTCHKSHKCHICLKADLSLAMYNVVIIMIIAIIKCSNIPSKTIIIISHLWLPFPV